MTTIRDIRRKKNRDLHLLARVPALYLRMREADPVECNVRLHLKNALAGNISGARVYGAQIEDQSDQVVFDLTEIATPRNAGIICLAEGEAYQIDRMKVAMDGFQTAEVTRIPADKADGLPYPDPA